MIQSNNTVVDRIMRAGLATPALALTILAGAAFAQSGGGSGRAYEVIVETDEAGDADEAPRAGIVRRQDGQNVRTVVEINRIVNGKTLSVRRVNDDPIVVKLDGKELTEEHYTMKDGVVVITMPGSNQTVELTMPGQAFGAGGNPFAGSFEIKPDAPGVPGRIQLRGNTDGDWAQAQVAEAPQPKVMLGVVMTEPDAMILEHLGLDAKKAVLLERVVDGLPADKAGLESKDIIVGFGEKAEPRTADEIREVLAKADPGSVVKVKVIRKGRPVTVDLKLEAFDAQALGRVAVAGGGGGQVRNTPQATGQWRALEAERGQQHSHMERAEKAMKEAAEMLARMERDVDRTAADAHKKASQAIEKAIAAMKEGDAAGMELEDMRRIQQEAIERLRGDLANNQNNRRFWAEQGDGGGGFALTVPGEDREDQWAERLEQLEHRLDRLEQTFDKAMDRVEARTEAMIERLMDRLERALDDRDRDEGR
ncbi:MAG: PDZ domain-containing protein [Phycisphaerales bacterium JB060]